jgi:hypothetical protein
MANSTREFWNEMIGPVAANVPFIVSLAWVKLILQVASTMQRVLFRWAFFVPLSQGYELGGCQTFRTIPKKQIASHSFAPFRSNVAPNTQRSAWRLIELTESHLRGAAQLLIDIYLHIKVQDAKVSESRSNPL